MSTVATHQPPRVEDLKRATLPFDRFVVFANPRSSGRHQANQKIHQLTQLFPETPIETFETSTGGAMAYATLLHEHATKLGPRTLLCVAAGDGSINFLAQALLLDRTLPAHVRKTPILPLWGGNGNDLASILNGHVTRTTMQMIFADANVVPIRAMEFRMVQSDGVIKERIACVTAGFGAIAQAARRLNDVKYRHSRLHKVPGGRYLKEGLIAWWAMASSPTFKSEQSGKATLMYECTFCNGPRMAKWYRTPVQLDDEQFYVHVMEGKVAIITPTKLTLSFRRRSSDAKLYKTTELLVREAVWAQFDGEPELIPADTEITVQLSTNPLYVFSRLLSAV
jgi:hypothetical protein